MIIGYSFNDDHINEHLTAGARAGAKLFIVDPFGLDVIDKRDPRVRAHYPPLPLFQNLRDNCIGASRRRLRTTLHSDRVECKKLAEFLEADLDWISSS
jgi:hypothetical protein